MKHLSNFRVPTKLGYVDADNVPNDDDFIHAE